MNWLFFALIAPAVYAVATFIDKYILSKEIKDYRSVLIYGTITGFIGGIIYWVMTGFPILNTRDTLIVLVTGMLTIWSLAFYLNAMSLEEASKINIFFQMFPVFTLILSFIFLKEVISLNQFLGFGLILTATIGISIEEGQQKFKLSKAFWLILIYDLLWATSGVLMKFAINANSFAKILSYESWGIGLGGLILYLFFPGIRNAFNKSLTTTRKFAIGIIFVNEVIFIVAKAITFLAFSLGPVALVSVLEGTQVFYAIFFGWILTLIVPSIFQEDISRKALIKKVLASIVLIIGIVFVYF